MIKKWFVIWDLGATKCAAAVVSFDVAEQSYKCVKSTSISLREHGSLPALAADLEQKLNIDMGEADAICICASGVYFDGVLHHAVGYPYPMEFAKLQQALNWRQLSVVHDYVPVLCATFTAFGSGGDMVKVVREGSPDVFGRRVAFGIGTGLGMKDGVLREDGSFWLGTNEMGHVGLSAPPITAKSYYARHLDILKFIEFKASQGSSLPLTFETILSGRGVSLLHQFLTNEQEEVSPEEIGELAKIGKASETMALFSWYLGLFVGGVELALMPSGGIWMTGGVLQKHPDLVFHPEFQKGINSSTAYMEAREKIPLAIFTDHEHVFVGGAYYAANRLLV